MNDKAANTITTIFGLVMAVIATFAQSTPTAVIAAALLICGELGEISSAIAAKPQPDQPAQEVD